MFDKMNIKVRDNLYTDMDMIIFNYESDNKEIKCAKCNCDKIYSHKNNFDIVNAVDETLEELNLEFKKPIEYKDTEYLKILFSIGKKYSEYIKETSPMYLCKKCYEKEEK